VSAASRLPARESFGSSLGEGGFFNLRTSIALVVFGAAACSMLSGVLLAFFRPEASSNTSQRTLTFAERVAYQRVIEDVYWRHRIWPRNRGERPDPKPSLDAVMSQTQLQKKVEGYLRDSQALESYWQKPIAPEQLQAEMERMARDTKQPEVLRELFEAFGNDPFVIAECLARPVLTERLVAELSTHDKGQRFALLRTQAASNNFSITRSGKVTYRLPEIDPCIDDTWTATSIVNAPNGRNGHTAVWTGSEMIVWGGQAISDSFVNTGGRYNPATDSWTATNTTNAPTARWHHSAVWTGSEMIVWGGDAGGGSYLNTGGRYNPCTDTWSATSTTNAPAGRADHTAVWTGSEMIVWGGYNGSSDVNTGGRYNPSTDMWTATDITNAPQARSGHTAVWTGSEMIIWGGNFGQSDFNTGGRYNPGTDSWRATSTTNAPAGRSGHTAVWTGSEMIIWGGGHFAGNNFIYLNSGGRYNPSTDSWTSTSTTNAPLGRLFHSAVWTVSEMIVWGGYFDDCGLHYVNSGGRYNPGTDSWTATSTTNAPAGRREHTAVWTGGEMIVWGGYNGSSFLNTGGRYCAQSNPPPPTPTATPTTTATPCHVINTQPVCGSLISGLRPTDFVVNLSDAADPASVNANAFMVNCIPANTFTLQNANMTIVFHFNTTPVTLGQNTMHIPAGAFNCGNGPVAEFTCTFTYEVNTPTPTASPSPTSSPTPSITPTPTSTPTPTASPTPTPTATAMPTASPTATPRPSPTPRPRPTLAPRP
jgi:N-acetylneuraminic acid mutarotase